MGCNNSKNIHEGEESLNFNNSASNYYKIKPKFNITERDKVNNIKGDSSTLVCFSSKDRYIIIQLNSIVVFYNQGKMEFQSTTESKITQNYSF